VCQQRGGGDGTEEDVRELVLLLSVGGVVLAEAELG
jgi:hypothetical protein